MPTVADLMAETLTVAGVKRIYGVVGDSLVVAAQEGDVRGGLDAVGPV